MKIVLKSNCKYVPADGVVRAQNKCEIGANVLPIREVTGKNVTDTVKVFKKRLVTPTFYVTKWK